MSIVKNQFFKWSKEYNQEESAELIVKWLNRQLQEPSVPENISGASWGRMSNGGVLIFVEFINGMGKTFGTGFSSWKTSVYTLTPPPARTPGLNTLDMLLNNISPTPKSTNTKIENKKLNKSTNTVRLSRILVLCPIEFENVTLGLPNVSLFQWHIIASHLKDYEIDIKRTTGDDIKFEEVPPLNSDPNNWDKDPYGNLIFKPQKINMNSFNNRVEPNDFANIENYGIIVIHTHGGYDEERNLTKRPYIMCCVICDNDNDISTWMYNNRTNRYIKDVKNDGIWFTIERPFESNPLYYQEILCLTDNFFKTKIFNNSFVFINACYSWEMRDAFIGTKAYLGNTKNALMIWSNAIMNNFFMYLIKGDYLTDPNASPMSFGDAYNKLNKYDKWNPCPPFFPTPTPLPFPLNEFYAEPPPDYIGCELKINPSADQCMDTYFPAPVTIVVQGKKEGKQ